MANTTQTLTAQFAQHAILDDESAMITVERGTTATVVDSLILELENGTRILFDVDAANADYIAYGMHIPWA